MEIVVAVGHFAGAIVAIVILGAVVLFFDAWIMEGQQKQANQELAIKLGVSIEALETDEHKPEVIRFFGERFSSELLRNRIADLCGLVRTLWGWLGSLVQLGGLAWVGWETVTDQLENGAITMRP